MKKDITISISINNAKPLYDENGLRVEGEELESILFNKIKEIIAEYCNGGGAEIDFINGDFGVDDAIDFSYYGDIKIEVK